MVFVFDAPNKKAFRLSFAAALIGEQHDP